MATKLLLVGLATDGPSNITVRPKDERDLRFLFGGGYIERIFVSPTATGCSLGQPPWQMPINIIDSTKKNYLYAPYLDTVTNQIYFGNIGGTGFSQVDFIYTPYLGKSDLLYAARKYFSELNELPYVMRLGGTKASFILDGWEFEAKYAGTKYNQISITFDPTSTLIAGLEPNYNTAKYISSNPDEIRIQIERDYQANMIPITCVKAGSAMLSTGTYYLSGGLDGSFDEADVTYILENSTIPIDVTHVVLLSPLTSGLVNIISDHLGSSMTQPRVFFLPAPEYTSPTSDWLDTQMINIPYRNNMICSFIGDITSNLDGKEVTRYAAEGAAIAFSKVEGFNLTNVPVSASSFSPVLNESDLQLVKGAGWIPLMRWIGNDIATYEGTTTHNENTFLYSSKVAEISAIANNHCFQFMGMILPDGDRAEISQPLANKLSKVGFFQLQLVKITVKGDSMYVYIEGFLPSEILKISFTIKNR